MENPTSPESSPNTQPEKAAETEALQPGQPVPAPSEPSQPASVAPPTPTQTGPADRPVAKRVKESGPPIADDVDVIEKEWVDKASEVVHKTAGDPYQEEESVEDLQTDYLKKRYGIDLGSDKEK